MIYNTLNNLSKSVQGFWQFWSLHGLVLMTSAAFNLFFNWVRGNNLYRLVE